MGDNLTGAGDGDDEQIKIDLSISQRLHLQLPSMMQRQDARISDRFLMPL